MRRFFDFGFDSDDDEAILAMLAQESAARFGESAQNMINMYLNFSTPVTVVNTTTETSLLGTPDVGTTKTILPSSVSVGRTFELFFSGIMGNTGAPTCTIRLKLNTTAIFTAAIILTAAGTFSWRFPLFVTISATGVGGAVLVEPGGIEIDVRPDGFTRTITTPQLSVPIDFSVDEVWGLSEQWSVADLLNTFTYNFGCINIVR